MLNSNEGWPLLGEIERAIAREYNWPGYFSDEKKSTNLSSNILAAYAGAYTSKSGLQFSVTNGNGILFLQSADQPSIELHPISETRFFISTLNTEVTFDRTEQGEVKGLNISQEERQISAERKR